MGRAKIAATLGAAAVRATLEGGQHASGQAKALAVRYLLQELADAVPGNTLEIRVPPFGAVQCVEGPNHSRGTPPNVVEMDAETWIALATGSLEWSAALASDQVSASGTRATLERLLPLEWNERQ